MTEPSIAAPAAADASESAPAGRPTDETVAALRAAVMVLSRRMRYHSVYDDVSPSESMVLGRLNKGPLTPGALARLEHVRPPSMTRTVERLVSRGYIHREADPADGRQVLLTLTGAGRDFTTRSRQLRTAWLAGQFAKLDAKDQRVLSGAADTLRRLAELT